MSRKKRVSKCADSLQTPFGEIDYLLSRSTGRKTLSICVNDKGEVKVSAPYNTPDKEIISFIEEKSKWIIKHVRQTRYNQWKLNQKKFDHGHQFLFLGKKHELQVVESNARRARLRFNGLKWLAEIPFCLTENEREKQVKNKLIQWYRLQAQEILGSRIFHYSRRMGVTPKKIAIRSQKNLWGNCDYNTQTIHLNWQIILSPLKVVDYIVVHELCHLTIPNHSKRFWKRVEKYMPDFQEYKQWLKDNRLEMILP